MPEPERLDIYTYSNDAFERTFVCCDDDGVALDITGYTAELTVKDKQAGTTIATLTVGSGITITGATGTIAVSRTAEQVQAWKIDRGFYQLQWIPANGKKKTLVQGVLEVVNV